MADTARLPDIVSVEDYLAHERASSLRHEFVGGAIYAMSGGSRRHNLIAVNLTAALTAHLPDRCAAHMADTKLRIRLQKAELFYYPNTMVCCAASDQSLDWIEDPIAVAEVLSPSSERVDRGEKFNSYIQIPSLQEYILIDQSMVRIELFRRSNQWQREVLVAGDTLHLPSIDFALPVDALYRRVEF